MYARFSHKATHYLLRFVQLQLFITLVSLPILVSWGLPLSLLSPVGNLIFSPVLMLFLLLCSLVFFLELCCIPNSIFIYVLEKLTHGWLSFMHCAGKRFLIGFVQPPTLFLFLVPLCAFAIIQHSYTKPVKRSIACLLLLLCVSCAYLKLISTPYCVATNIPCNNGSVHIMREHQQTVVIDPGVIGQRISAPSWVEYTLIPNILQTTGNTTIDHLIVLQPGRMLFEAITVLCKKMQVKNLYLPCWHGSLTKSGWRHYFALKRTAQEHGTTITRIGFEPLTIPLSEHNNLSITPIDHTIKHADTSYPALRVNYEPNQFILHSKKYNKTV